MTLSLFIRKVPYVVLIAFFYSVSISLHAQTVQWTPAAPEFRKFYGWDESSGRWDLEMIPFESGKRIALHIFSNQKPEQAVGTLFLLHGYLEHTALRVPLAIEALEHNYIVAGFDLPGHGLSEGNDFTIDDFAQYRIAFESVIASHEWPKPWRVIAHSTGASAALLYIQQNGNPFELTIFESPLLRSYLYDLSMFALSISAPIVKTLPRRIGGVGKDQPFYQLLVKDPLYPHNMPTSWCAALKKYVSGLKQWHSIQGDFIIIQGENDTVVDKNYNMKFLKKKLISADYIMIKDGTHILLRYEGKAGDIARKAISQSWP